MTPTAGVLVMAYGSGWYHRQAGILALSLRRHSPALPRTLVTDRPKCAAARHFDIVLPLEGPSGSDCRQKLSLDRYTPYDQTLYLDSDSVAVRPVEPLFDLLGEDMTVFGAAVSSGHWYTDVAEMRRHAGTSSVPKFSAGTMLLRASDRTRSVFARARELAGRYREFGFDCFHGGIADEPLLSLALAEAGIAAREPGIGVSATPIGVTGPIRMDVLSGWCEFPKYGRPVRPTVMHFAADFSARFRLSGALYRREALKLRLAVGRGWPDGAARFGAAVRHGASAALLDLWLRVLRRAPRDPAAPAFQHRKQRAMT